MVVLPALATVWSVEVMAMKLPKIPSISLERQRIQWLQSLNFHQSQRWLSPKNLGARRPWDQAWNRPHPAHGAHGGEMPRYQMNGTKMAATARTSAALGAPRACPRFGEAAAD